MFTLGALSADVFTTGMFSQTDTFKAGALSTDDRVLIDGVFTTSMFAVLCFHNWCVLTVDVFTAGP